MNKFSFFLSLFVFFGIALNGFAQAPREIINGSVLVPPGDEVGGITIFNKNAGRGTATNAEGDFAILARRGDSLIFSAVQFEAFTIVMSEHLAELGTMTVNLNRAVNDLPEVRLSDLSGIVEVDVNRIRTMDTRMNMVSNIEMRNLASMPQRYKANYVRNDAMGNKTASDFQGLNFVNIFKSVFGLFGEKEEKSRKLSREELADELFYKMGENFYVESLNLERAHTSSFIFYVIDNGFTQQMLENSNELEIMQYLFEQKEMYSHQPQ
ncbi:hypothetical protein RM553_06220 [Zunongwangia sp. F363]|uniref:Carboxypeptidase-like regulatory domain-containing protein n=1 Tax=Autumnicola tepida TaxID=3075595 RepID=A0ABU3C7V7_9FLAO|nr:hypothetical protein [Zunongwangia sp. F363]MDT0642424.1 hypothetical protein [Zunongwangia sp. F363]